MALSWHAYSPVSYGPASVSAGTISRRPWNFSSDTIEYRASSLIWASV